MIDLDIHPFCQPWNITFTALFHSGNAVLGAAYVMPKTFAYSLVSMRILITLGYALLSVWALNTLCQREILYWKSAFVAVNGLYVLQLLYRHLPTWIPRVQRELYKKLFLPFKVTKKEFKTLMKDATIRPIRAGQPMEFVDSIEFWAHMTNSERADGNFQVSIDVVQDSQLLELPLTTLDKTLNDHPELRLVLRCLTAQDVTRKLYLLHENVQHHSRQKPLRKDHHHHRGHKGEVQRMDFSRSNSLDAINTGCRGFVRSRDWIKQVEIKDEHEPEQLMVVNLELDVVPSLGQLAHGVPVATIDKTTIAEAQFLQQQKKYWPANLI